MVSEEVLMEKLNGLVNDLGLIPMLIVSDDFAPYQVDTVAGFQPEEAVKYIKMGVALPCNERKEVVAVDLPRPRSEPESPPPPQVNIPSDWEELHEIQLNNLADQITGMEEVRSEEAARDIIAAELSRRESRHGREQNEVRDKGRGARAPEKAERARKAGV